MPLELESYLNVPRISEIEPFPAACAPGTVYVRHFAAMAAMEHAALLSSRMPISRAPRHHDKPRVEIFFDHFPPPPYGTDSRDVSSIYDGNTRCGNERSAERMKR